MNDDNPLEKDPPALPLLFQHGRFKAASGRMLNFKIECDNYVGEQWRHVAAIVGPRIPRFSKVIGVPRGGIPFAEQLMRYATPDSDVTLFVDDVWTTGGSMRKVIKAHAMAIPGDPRPDYSVRVEGKVRGVVLFARGGDVLPSWVDALWTLTLGEDVK